MVTTGYAAGGIIQRDAGGLYGFETSGCFIPLDALGRLRAAALLSQALAHVAKETIDEEREADMARTPQSIKVKVQVDLGEEAMLAHLVDTWGTAGLIRRAIGPVPTEQIDAVLAVAVRADGRIHPRTPYADEPQRPEQPQPGQRHLDLLESIPEGQGRLIGLLVLAVLLATILLLLVT